MGQVFYPAAVRTLTTEPSDAIDGGLLALLRKQFVRPERSDLSTTDALGFRHLLIRDAAYGSIPKATRGDLHERFADWLDETAGSLGERDEIVGYHLEQAYRYRTELGPADDHTWTLARMATERLAAAGRQALARRDASATANLLGRAVDLLPLDDPRRPDIQTDLGLALSRSDLPRADHVLVEAMEGARVLGAAARSARGRPLGVRPAHVRPRSPAASGARRGEALRGVVRGMVGYLGSLKRWNWWGPSGSGQAVRDGRGGSRAREGARAPGRERTPRG